MRFPFFLIILAGQAAPPDSATGPQQKAPDAPAVVAKLPTPQQVRAAIDHGIEFLLKDQNPDGSWGGARGAVYTFTGDVWSNPETQRSWKVATTGLCCLALMEVGASETARAAVDRGLDYLLHNAAVKQPNEWDTMNNWAYIYGLQALAVAGANPRYSQSSRHTEIHEMAVTLLQRLADFQAISGGWGYLEFDVPRTRRPQWSTSFTTAAAVVAMQDAQASGFTLDVGVLHRAVRAIQRCRLPSGAFTYSVSAIADPRNSEWIDQIKGSLGRIQVCNLALLLSGESIPPDRLKTGLDHLFREHRFMDIARNRPIPHETYYYNSGYFYFFGHYYAARVIEQLPAADQPAYWPRLRHEVMKTQQKDGSMWDYDMHAYHKPYGVAFGIMTLGRSLHEPAGTVPADDRHSAGARVVP